MPVVDVGVVYASVEFVEIVVDLVVENLVEILLVAVEVGFFGN